MYICVMGGLDGMGGAETSGGGEEAVIGGGRQRKDVDSMGEYDGLVEEL